MPKVLRADGMNKCIGCFTCMITCAAVNEHNHCISKSRIKIRTYGGMGGRMISAVCLACRDERACAQACPSGALEKRPGGGVELIKEKCIGCRRCEKACMVGAVMFHEEEAKPLICKHCGICAKFCPHECLRLEEVNNDL